MTKVTTRKISKNEEEKLYEELIQKDIDTLRREKSNNIKKHNILDILNNVGTILIGLSKTFYCLPHDLIIAKLHAYGLDHDSLRLIRSYLSNRHQRIKLDSVFSSWIQTIIGVPQGFIPGPLLFNIFLNDLLLINLRSNVCKTLYYCGETTVNVIKIYNQI